MTADPGGDMLERVRAWLSITKKSPRWTREQQRLLHEAYFIILQLIQLDEARVLKSEPEFSQEVTHD